MGVLDINKQPQNGATPIAGVPASFFINADEILTRLDGYGCYIQRNGNNWTIVIDREAGYQEQDIYRDAVRLEYDASASLVNVTTPAAFKVAVGTAYVTVGAGTASLSTAYNAVSTAGNRFYWVKLSSTGGAFSGTLEKGNAFPAAAGDQNVVTPSVNAYVRLWEVLVSATKVTRILSYSSPLSTFS
jgi:hypothetical protein